jgi:hypothetical protein
VTIWLDPAIGSKIKVVAVRLDCRFGSSGECGGEVRGGDKDGEESHLLPERPSLAGSLLPTPPRVDRKAGFPPPIEMIHPFPISSPRLLAVPVT